MSTEALDPADMLFGKTRKRVLGLLLSHPDESFYLRQIARESGAAQGAVQRELDTLTRAGLLRRRVHGRQVYFQVADDAPYLQELRALFEKTAGMAAVIREALAPLADRIEAAFLFGSAAHGGLRKGSDLDLFVLGSVPFQEVVHAVADAQRRLSREINPVVYPPEEFRIKRASGHPFLKEVLNGPRTILLGDDARMALPAADRPRRATPSTRKQRVVR
ncbi:MAG TPA: nucleotidyltransferase domain-containing protein [Candidatus Polarisedimenticolaceae bacterium]|nr:nucleotidyltransferase domain-containing protein [Candidatus Polarisedimenticolaceae bacterium]